MKLSGNVKSIFNYEPYGVEIPPYNESAQNSHKFTGHERDETTGFDYMHFRYYGSNIGRFMKPDNVTGSPLNPQNWNLYSYVRGNPVNMNDPTGHQGEGLLYDSMSEGKIQSPSGVARFYDDDGGGGIPGKSEDRPLLTVYLVNKAGLNPTQIGDIKTEIRDIYAKGGIDVNFKDTALPVSWSAAPNEIVKELTILSSVTDRAGQGKIPSGAIGSTDIGVTRAYVYADAAMKKIGTKNLASSDLARAIGRGGAHELGHTLGLPDDLTSMKNLMQRSHTDPTFWSGKREQNSYEMYFKKEDIAAMLRNSWGR